MARRSKSDIANSAVRILLQDVGRLYDQRRGFEPFRGKNDLPVLVDFFGGRCCFCDAEFRPGNRATLDHLVPMNKESCGLDAWGNVVPCCRNCNGDKQAESWTKFIDRKVASKAVRTDRKKRVRAFIRKYKYAPPFALAPVADELYGEVGAISKTLIDVKLDRLQADL